MAGDLEKAKEVLLESKVSLQGSVEELESQLAAKEDESARAEAEAERKLQETRRETERQKDVMVSE